MAGTKKSAHLRGVCLWEVANVGFICGWDQKSVHLREVSTHGRLKM